MAVTTADGLVLGADSMTRVREGTREKYYENANKVFDIPGLPIVAMTYGQGALGRRSIESLVREWCTSRVRYEKRAHSVEEVAHDLGEFVFGKHREHRAAIQRETEERQLQALTGNETSDNDKEPFDPSEWTTGIVVGGYQPKCHYPFLYSWEEPARSGIDEGLVCERPHEGDDGPEPGVNYWGDRTALDRLFYGHDGHLDQALRKLQIDKDQLDSVLGKHQWEVLFESMPLQDAEDMVRFLLSVGCGFERFKVGTPQIGGGVDIAVVSRVRTHWPDRKRLTRALYSPSEAYAIGEPSLDDPPKR